MTTPGMAESVAVPRLELIIEREGAASPGRVIEFEGERCRIGSHPSNDVVLSDGQVSRFHCELSPGRAGWRVVDSGSMNGTSVAGVRVRDADLPRPECRLELGASVLRVRELGLMGQAAVPVWPSFGAIYGTSLVMRRLFGVLDRVARSEANVLLEGRERHGQRAGGDRDRAARGACRSGVRHRRLRGDRADADRERTVRPRAWRLHGRDLRPRGRVRGGRGGHDLPRRDRRDAARDAAEVAARDRGARGAPRRRESRAQDRRSPHRRDQPSPRTRGEQRALSRRTSSFGSRS